MGIDKEPDYIALAKERMNQLWNGELPYRPLGKPVHQPTGKEKVSQIPESWQQNGKQKCKLQEDTLFAVENKP
jgi:hypothetical protein